MTQASELAYVLKEVKEASLATVRPDGWPQATVVSFVTDGETLWFDCLKTSQKAHNLARDPRVSLTLMVPYMPWGPISAFSLAGRVRRLTTKAEIDAFVRRWRARFPYMDRVLAENLSDFEFFELKPEFVSPMDYIKGLGHGREPRHPADAVAHSNGGRQSAA